MTVMDAPFFTKIISISNAKAGRRYVLLLEFKFVLGSRFLLTSPCF